MIVRLMRVAVQQNTILEERAAREKDEAIAALAALREDVAAIVHREAAAAANALAAAVDERFAAARFPFLGDRLSRASPCPPSRGRGRLESRAAQPEAVERRGEARADRARL